MPKNMKEKKEGARVNIGRNILVVEDERIVALDIKSRLEVLGYSVCGIVETGEKSISAAEEKKPDLVLMDIMLEGEMDGIEAAAKIQSMFDIPVIFLSAYSDDFTIQRAKISEPYGYILKPFDGKDLHTHIEMAIYKHGKEKKLKEMESRLAITLRSIGEAVITTDSKRCVTFINPVAEALTGWAYADAVGKDMASLFTIVGEDRRTVIEDPIRKVMKHGEIVQVDSAILMSLSGFDIPINFSAAPIMNENSAPSGVVLIFRDITEQKRSQDETARLLQKLRSGMNALINALVMTVETRDPYTAGHQRRVTNLARAIAGEMGLSSDCVDGIRMAGTIHDLGKISVPAEILTRPGKLSSIEFSLIQTHPRVGYEILKEIDFNMPVAEIVYQHHERMDGSGYPRGLTGGSILIESRVIAIADVVEAMASHRPYRPALGIEQSLGEIRKNRGILYDPDVVDACIRVFVERGFQL
jgi:PAS domain S-box-containing protein/putative nucleotidyltransferase with HDIG domain